MGLQRVGIAAGCALPGVLIIYFAFQNGGFYEASVATAAVIIALGLVVHTVTAETPFSGANLWLAAGAGGLALFAAWTAASQFWSDGSFHALIESNRAVFYVLVVAAAATVAGRPWWLRWMVRLTGLAILVI